jgi:hypothetical protein
MRVVTRNARWAPPPACGCSCSFSLHETGELVFGGGTGGRDGRSAVEDHQGDFFSSSNGEDDRDREGLNGGADFGPPFLPLPLPPLPRAYAAAGMEEGPGGGDGFWGDDALAMRCGGRMSENEARRLCLRAEVELRRCDGGGGAVGSPLSPLEGELRRPTVTSSAKNTGRSYAWTAEGVKSVWGG